MCDLPPWQLQPWITRPGSPQHLHTALELVFTAAALMIGVPVFRQTCDFPPEQLQPTAVRPGSP